MLARSLQDLAAEFASEVLHVSDPPTDHDKSLLDPNLPFVVTAIQWVKDPDLAEGDSAVHGLCSIFKSQFENWEKRATMHRCGRKVKDHQVARISLLHYDIVLCYNTT